MTLLQPLVSGSVPTRFIHYLLCPLLNPDLFVQSLNEQARLFFFWMILLDAPEYSPSALNENSGQYSQTSQVANLSQALEVT